MFAVFKKEMGAYLNTPLGYVSVILFGLVANFLFVRQTFITGAVTFSSFFFIVVWLFLVFVPAVAMRSFSDEKRLNTLEVLLSMPLAESKIVVAKFLSLLVLITLGLALTLTLPMTFYTLAHVYIPEVAVGYLGIFLTAASFAAISMFFSSLTKNQILSFLGSFLTLLALVGSSTQLIISLFPPFIQSTLSTLSPLYHMQNFMKGIVDFRSVFYFIGLTLVFLFLTIMQIEKRD